MAKSEVQNTDFEALQSTINALSLTVEQLGNRLYKSEEDLKRSQNKVELHRQGRLEVRNSQLGLVNSLEEVIFSLITSLKTLQIDTRVMILNMNTKLQAVKHELDLRQYQLDFVREKLEMTESSLLEYKRISEVKLLSMHWQYINVIEKVSESLVESMEKEKKSSDVMMQTINDRFYETVLGSSYKIETLGGNTMFKKQHWLNTAHVNPIEVLPK